MAENREYFAIDNSSDVLFHYGILRRSGRYPWGSGSNAEQRSRTFLGMVDDLKKSGLTETEIAKALLIGRLDEKTGNFYPSTTDLRALKSLANNQRRAADVSMVRRLKDKGMSNVAIGQRLEMPESTVRAYLKDAYNEAKDIVLSIASMLKGEVDTQGSIDVGTGVENHLGVSKQRLDVAVAALKEEGYEVKYLQVDQLGTDQKTTIKVLAPPGTKTKDLYNNLENIGSIAKVSTDHGRSWLGLRKPESVASNRIMIRYAENGGTDADGTMYVRRGVKDLDMGGSEYAQVRIAVDDTHYLKGMAIYKDDLPPGVDIVFNTNKSNTGDKLNALKPMKKLPQLDADGKPVRDAKGNVIDSDNVDWANPFGAAIKPNGQRGALNIVNEEGDWDEWSRTLSSQMLSKQPNSLAKQQLEKKSLAMDAEFDEIMSLTNPAVRKNLLEKFAESADAAAVKLDAAGMPKQRTQVILPMNSMRDNEIYAPNFNDGESVVLIRYPHGGKFEIPELRVNNRNKEAKGILGNAKDAVGINSKVAARLSGADFDGDTVLVIPNNSGKIKTSAPLKELVGFDPQSAYPAYPGMKRLDERGKQLEMGKVSNLITDMTIQGAPANEIARAVKHSMVVIDAEKHNLNYKLSEKENGIPQLKEKYQGRSEDGKLKGASTIISRASSEVRVPQRRLRKASEGGPIDPATGKKVFVNTGETYTKVSKSGKVKEEPKTTKSKAMAEVDDAFTLTSGGSAKNPGTVMEKLYATHANHMKDLANQARKASIETPRVKRDPSAAKTYAAEVESLKAKVHLAQLNSPLERKAQMIGNAQLKQRRQSNPDLSNTELKRLKGQLLAEARIRVGAKKERVSITDAEWNAIQSGAVSHSLLEDILKNADPDNVRGLAQPRTKTAMTDIKLSKGRAMAAAGRTPAEIAESLGVSVTTVKDYLF